MIVISTSDLHLSVSHSTHKYKILCNQIFKRQHLIIRDRTRKGYCIRFLVQAMPLSWGHKLNWMKAVY